ncbi:MAG TPA: DUF6089 family protein [Segetibacter sp.]|jgi:hypothetical protein
MKTFYLRIVLLLITLPAGINSTFCQYFFYNDRFYDKDLLWEAGASLGLMNSLTDVGQIKSSSSFPLFQADFRSSKLNGSIYWGALYKNTIGARLELTVGSVSADDKKGTVSRQLRNFSYQSSIKEIALIGELHLLTIINGESLYKLSPYLQGGLGMFAFNPKTKYNDELVELQPLNTEGQSFTEYPGRTPYKLSALCMPFGIGLKYEVSALITGRFEILGRYAFTDYLDDASKGFIDESLYDKYFTPEKAAIAKALSHRYKEVDPTANLTGISRGGVGTKDKYMSINLKIAYTIGRERIR